jgi:periplasmic protein TonB
MQLTSLNATHTDGGRSSFQKIASIGLHVLVIGALTYQVGRAAKVVPPPRRTASVIVPYAPGHKAMVRPPKPKIVPPKEEPKLAEKQPEPPPPSSGGDPTGEADVTVASATFYPDPKPDLSVLPHGTKGDVVLDIVIDESGKVVDAQVDSGLGHGLDEAVMAVIETWTFDPATRAGKPVASKQQLLFHFERA